MIEGDNKPSNLFADLVFYLLKNTSQGVGNVVPAELVDEDSLRATARFLRANKIFYDGVIEDTESFRTFIYDNAPLSRFSLQGTLLKTLCSFSTSIFHNAQTCERLSPGASPFKTTCRIKRQR